VKLKFLVLGLLVVSGAFADAIVVADFEFSGATPPAGPSPWITANFKDLVGGGVELTVANTGLVGSEYVSGFYFNLDPALLATSYHPSATGTGTQSLFNSISSGTDAYKADGDGHFDFLIDFPNGNDDRFTAGETFVVKVGVGDGSITSDDFLFPSVNGPVGKNGFLIAAHVQSIGTSGGSGWVTGGLQPDPRIVEAPEPSSIALLGTVLVGACYYMRKRRAA
jgi:hypothetical protein